MGWLYLEPNVYLHSTNAESLLYNTLNGDRLVVSDPLIVEILKEIVVDANRGVVFVEEHWSENNSFNEFRQILSSKEMGGVVTSDLDVKRPIRPRPIYKLDNDIEIDLLRNKSLTLNNLLDNLIQVNLYVNGSCEFTCGLCNSMYQQLLMCAKWDLNEDILNETTLKSILDQIIYSSISKFNVLGGQVLRYPYLNLISKKLNEVNVRPCVYAYYKHVLQNSYCEFLDYVIMISSDISISEMEVLDAWGDNLKYNFIVTSEDDAFFYETLIDRFRLMSYRFVPLYTGSNIRFFEENVFTSLDDIFCRTFSHRDIFAHQKVNANYFGCLSIFPDGSVKASINADSIGNVMTSSIGDLIYNELINNTAWRKIRDNKPCCDCLYQFLCPSPSDYEAVIGKCNLCNIV